jgi:hypothetical protein
MIYEQNVPLMLAPEPSAKVSATLVEIDLSANALKRFSPKLCQFPALQSERIRYLLPSSFSSVTRFGDRHEIADLLMRAQR